ncbi:MAG: hypothetical protein EZS28_021594 [Streblomastix strix]|uniref:Uncharacterized protein n=1 Tax=Streblomastix strix TaxID=222440 RepID=A0A5J4VJV3_9EUKA|nr:MAG: hypothetical protein EZS28_021594 [Streblomastix strix]
MSDSPSDHDESHTSDSSSTSSNEEIDKRSKKRKAQKRKRKKEIKLKKEKSKNTIRKLLQKKIQNQVPNRIDCRQIIEEFVKPEDSGKLEHFWVLPGVKKAMQGDELEQTLEKAGLSQTSPRGTETRGVKETTKRDQSFPVGIPGLSQPIPPDTTQKSTYRRNAFFTTPINAYMETQWKDL